MTTIIIFKETGTGANITSTLSLEDKQLRTSEDLEKADLEKLQSFQKRYQDRPKNKTNQKTLLALGQDIYDWLNEKLDFSAITKQQSQPWNVEFLLEAFPESDFQKIFINLPWEILADDKGFLAQRRGLSYNPYRRIYKEPKDKAKISEARLSLMFMAASPEGVNQLDYEAEEMAILEATGGLEQNKLDLYVEESGNLKQLANELQRIERCDVLHLSCHGTAENPPSLIMENSYGEKEPQNADQLFEALQNVKPPCLVLSACNTADADTDVLCLSLIQSSFQGVIGMAGAVSDKDATAFTAHLYKQLSESASLQNAMGNTRYKLLNGENPVLDWHLPRLFLNTNGGGVLCNGTKSHLGNLRNKKQTDFMGDKDNPVASDQEYAGRRRQIQYTLDAWRKGNCAGVMLTGMGRQGKSSTALRLSSRSHHHDMVVLYKHYDTQTLLRKLNEVGRQDVTDIIEKYQEQAGDNPQVLSNCLIELLQGPFAIADDNNQSLLLIIDDLETILEPQKGQKHQLNDLKLAQTLQAIIQSFKQTTSDARLLITSRYEFTLKPHNKDYADYLHIEHMPPMNEAESRKQCRKRQKRNGESENTLDWSLEQACIQAAKGNPGLQDWLFNLAFSAPEQCRKTVDQIKAYQGSGKTVDDEALNTWIENLVLTELIEQLEQGSRTLLTALTLFEIPVPKSTLQTLCNELKISDKQWEHVIALGLCDVYPQGEQHDVMVHPLIRHFFDKNTEQDKQALIKISLPELWKHWKNSPTDPQSAQLLALAVQIENLDIIKACAERGLYYLKGIKVDYKAAESLAIEALKLSKQQNSKLPSEALLWIGEILTGTVHQEEAMQCYKTALEQAKEEELDNYFLNGIRFSYSQLLTQNGKIEGALDQLEKARVVLKTLNKEKELASVNGEIARIRVSKGDVVGALKLHEARLAVYEGLGGSPRASGDIGRYSANPRIPRRCRRRVEVARGSIRSI